MTLVAYVHQYFNLVYSSSETKIFFLNSRIKCLLIYSCSKLLPEGEVTKKHYVQWKMDDLPLHILISYLPLHWTSGSWRQPQGCIGHWVEISQTWANGMEQST